MANIRQKKEKIYRNIQKYTIKLTRKTKTKANRKCAKAVREETTWDKQSNSFVDLDIE